ncbi:MerR family transcriptional regulator [Streptomyces sp. NPDC088752]|uniref:MerR family transcriptional regulator n=1 Tax=Streptomyces sp. NPDC088752 TaxID=3154963 RepID=UPI003422751A
MAGNRYGMTTGAVARHLGVSPTTVRTWEQRYGLRPAVREEGRHRRWTAEDVSMLEELCRLTASGVSPAEAARAVLANRDTATGGAPRRARPPDPSTGSEGAAVPGGARQPGSRHDPPLGTVRAECRGLARAAVRLDGPAMDDLLEQAVREHGLVVAWEEVVAPALHAVGKEWESTRERYVEVEHLLSWHVSTALRRMIVAGPAAPSTAPPVVLACTPTEAHTLPLEALAAGLAERALPVLVLGGAVPAEALDAAVRRCGPAVVALWSQARATADRPLAAQVAGTAFGPRGARTAPMVLLAGPGWAGGPREAGVLRPGGLREALDAVSQRYERLRLAVPDRARGPGGPGFATPRRSDRAG